MTKKELADYLAVSERTIDRLVASNQIQKIKVLGATRFRLKDVENFIEAQSN